MNKLFAFIDTQVFIQEKLNFNSKSLSILTEFVQNDEVDILMCPLQIQEVKRKISQFSISLVDNFIKARNKNQISSYFWTSLDHEISNIKPAEICQKVNISFANFIKETRPRFLKHISSDIFDVFLRKYKGLVPFQNPKKQDEYADAFHWQAVLNWAKQNGQTVYWVSGDPDFNANNDPQIEVIETLQKFLEIVSKRKDDFDQIQQLILSSERQIESKIKHELLSVEFYAKDWDHEFIESSNERVHITDFEIIDIEDKFVSISYETEIRLDVKLEIPDYDSSPYDSEDDKYYWLEKMEHYQDNILIIPVFVKIELSDDFSAIISFVEIVINDGRGIELPFQEYDERNF